MTEVWLRVKVRGVRILRALKVLPNIWYACEIELAKIRAEEYRRYFNGESDE